MTRGVGKGTAREERADYRWATAGREEGRRETQAAVEMVGVLKGAVKAWEVGMTAQVLVVRVEVTVVKALGVKVRAEVAVKKAWGGWR